MDNEQLKYIVEAALLAAGSVHAWFRHLLPGVEAGVLEVEASQVPSGCCLSRTCSTASASRGSGVPPTARKWSSPRRTS